MKPELVELPAATSDGVFLARYTETGLAGLDFPDGDGPAGPDQAEATSRPAIQRFRALVSANDPGRDSSRRLLPPQVRRWHQVTTVALQSVLAGKAPKALPPMDWTGKTPFQQSVWREMLKLRPGKTTSYGGIASAIGKPKAVRAVGGACGANPIPVLVPCHRVLAANKKIGGFSGGLAWKRRLLAREGAIPGEAIA